MKSVADIAQLNEKIFQRLCLMAFSNTYRSRSASGDNRVLDTRIGRSVGTTRPVRTAVDLAITAGRTLVERMDTGGVVVTKYVFFALLALLLVIAVGHLYAFRGLTDLYLGLPLWAWLQFVVVFVMIGIAWYAVQLVPTASERGV